MKQTQTKQTNTLKMLVSIMLKYIMAHHNNIFLMFTY